MTIDLPKKSGKIASTNIKWRRIVDKYQVFKLDEKDPNAVAAFDAERRLFAACGLEAKTSYVELPGLGIRLRISEIGSGKPVVIIPGNVGDAFPLAPLMAELKGRRIIAVNRPGGGGSDSIDYLNVDFREFTIQWLTALLDVLKLEKVPILAHSIGGHMSLLMALDKPERVSALVLPGVPGKVPGVRPPFFLIAMAIPGLNRIFSSAFSPRKPEEALKVFSLMGHSPETIARLPEAMADCYFYFGRLHQAQARNFMKRITRPDVGIKPEQLKSIKQPTMFLWGSKDTFGTVEAGRKIADLMPSATFHTIEGGGHLPWLDNVAEVSRLTLEFISDY